MRPSERSIMASFRRHGYKLTPQRRSVIRAITSSPDHLTPAAIHEKVAGHFPSISLVTVYRTLEILAAQGLLCELHAADGCHSYTIASPQDHHHLICSDCGRVVDFTTGALDGIEERLARQSGFAIERRLLEMVGRCRECQQQPQGASGS